MPQTEDYTINEANMSLINAFNLKNLDQFIEALHMGASPESIIHSDDYSYSTIMHLAIEQGVPGFVSALINFGADLYTLDSDGKTALSSMMIHIENDFVYQKLTLALFNNEDSLIYKIAKNSTNNINIEELLDRYSELGDELEDNFGNNEDFWGHDID